MPPVSTGITLAMVAIASLRLVGWYLQCPELASVKKGKVGEKTCHTCGQVRAHFLSG